MPVGATLGPDETLRDRKPDTQCDDSWTGKFEGAFALSLTQGTGEVAKMPIFVASDVCAHFSNDYLIQVIFSLCSVLVFPVNLSPSIKN